ncbi:hypothetical protein NDU88_006814 [Pleurodeles waltl]|uniref:Uncharacterized protein n=1 Tax=Pleurodeles waltl TaxID=8319 RepID=A0AAV7QM67_PLEWA|nr:hypothetical protein NDU88_006814 [Pleurodeles waltl]
METHAHELGPKQSLSNQRFWSPPSLFHTMVAPRPYHSSPPLALTGPCKGGMSCHVLRDYLRLRSAAQSVPPIGRFRSPTYACGHTGHRTAPAVSGHGTQPHSTSTERRESAVPCPCLHSVIRHSRCR